MPTSSQRASVDAIRAVTRGLGYAADGDYCNTIEGWCDDATISTALYFKLRRAGRGPLTGKAGRRTPVIESPPAYYRRMAGTR